MKVSKKLIVESPTYDYKLIKEEKNVDSSRRLYLKGPMLQFGVVNRNNRMYLENEMINEVARYIKEDVADGRAAGELEHPTRPLVALGDISHKIVSLEQDGNMFIGKALVARTPKGQILEALINDNIKIGMSSRALGQIKESGSGHNIVTGFELKAIDAVSSPSMSSAWTNGILESKEFICNYNEKNERIYEELEKSLAKYPSQHSDVVEKHITEAIKSFLAKL